MRLRLLLAGAMIAALAGTASAQRGGGGSRNRGDMAPAFVPSEPNRLDVMSQALDLNKDQKKQVRSIMDEGQKEAAPLREQLAKGRADLAAAIQAGKSQDEMNQAVKAYGDLEARMAAAEMGAFAKVYKLLDAGQQAKTRPVFVMMNGIFSGKNWTNPE